MTLASGRTKSVDVDGVDRRTRTTRSTPWRSETMLKTRRRTSEEEELFFERFPRQKRVLFAAQLSRVAHLGERKGASSRDKVWGVASRRKRKRLLMRSRQNENGTNV
jgi:hypothetical protein